jgi:hypothetical protein
MIKNVVTDRPNPVAGEYTIHLEFIPDKIGDISNHWARQYIIELQDQNIISLDDNLEFKPDKMITRAEAITMLTTTLKLSKLSQRQFRDVSKNNSYYNSISAALEAEIIHGYPDGNFGPEKLLSRAESVVVVAQVLKLEGIDEGTTPFFDISNDYWAMPILKQAYHLGLIDGYADSKFKPDQPTTRAEFASLIFRALFNK